MESPRCQKNGFTLIELLVVMGIVAVLSVVVIYTISPAELLRRARDSNRLSDLNIINKALNLYATDVPTGGSMGNASTTYVSVPDPTATSTAGTNCASLGLPTLPSGWTYRCATPTTYRNVNGQGWIPVNFKSISFGSPLGGALPVDPVNAASAGQYYTYVTEGSWKLASRLESEKYVPKAGTDGGPDPAIYELGSDLNLAPFLGGMVGWWTFDETGTTANDSSGYGNHGTMYSSTTTTNIHTSTDCRSGSCGSFDGVDDSVSISSGPTLNYRPVTFIVWVYATSSQYGTFVIGKSNYGGFLRDLSGQFEWDVRNGGERNVFAAVPAYGNWHHIVGTYDGLIQKIYVNGELKSSQSVSITPVTTYDLGIGACLFCGPGQFTKGVLDDVRIYNRALSAAEVAAIYNATK